MTYRPYSNIIQQASAAQSQEITLKNNSGFTISILQPVSVDSNGDIRPTNVSIESDAIKFLGVATENIPNGSSGKVILYGKLENISTSLSLGDYVYVSKSGGLTATLPSEGVDGFVAGDYVIRVGVIAKNQSNPLNKDLVLSPAIIGML